jgi:oxaloacetate decarboxylase alpha subunit
MAARRIGILDTTLRDAHQCLWATRMSTAHMLPIAGKLDGCGFVGAELMGMAHFDAAVRFLREDPFERIRLMSRAMPHTPLQGFVRSRCLRSFNPLPDDINALFVERMIENGIRRIIAFDGLHDWSNILEALRTAKRHGAYVTVWLIYTLAPGYTDAYYARKAKEIMGRIDANAIVIEDPSGLLTPDRVRTLVPAVRSAIGKTTLEFHTHCLTGLGPLATLEAAKAGADVLTTSIAPLADGNAPPATQTIVRNLRSMGFACDVDLPLVEEIGQHFSRVAAREGKPVGVPAEYDLFHYRHQTAGGVLSNLQSQLREVAAGHRLDEVLEECARVREDLGWPIIVTPFAQFVATQAAMNVLSGERYRVVPDEVKKYALGHFGRLPFPVKPDILDRIVESGARDVELKPPPLDPVVPALRARYPSLSDDERVLRFLFPEEQVDAMLAEQPRAHAFSVDHPLVELIREIGRRRLARVHVSQGRLRLDVSARPAGDA